MSEDRTPDPSDGLHDLDIFLVNVTGVRQVEHLMSGLAIRLAKFPVDVLSLYQRGEEPEEDAP